jgi:hypothetical protein
MALLSPIQSLAGAFRGPRAGDWRSVFETIASELRLLVSG